METKLDDNEINLMNFEEINDDNNEIIRNLLENALFEQYHGIVEISDFNRRVLDSTFKDSYGFYMSGKISLPSDPDIAYKEFIFKQYKSREKHNEIKTNLKFVNSVISEEISWPWGGPGDSKAKIFENIYAGEYKDLEKNNILCLEGIFSLSVRDKFEKIKVLSANDNWQLEKPLDPIIALQEWLYSKIGGKSKISSTPIKEFDYNQFFNTVFEGIKVLYNADDKEKDYAKESLEKLKERYFDKRFDSLIYLGYPRRNRSRSLVNPEGLCLGPRVLHLGCYYGDPDVFERLEDYQTSIGKSIDDLMKKREICRKAFGFHNCIEPIEKEILENGTYFGAILANLYSVGKKKELNESDISIYKTTVDNQTSRLISQPESKDLCKKWRYFLEAHKK